MSTKEENNFYCDICQKTFSNVSALNKHKKTESHLLRELKKEEDNYEHVSHKGKKEKNESYYFCPLCDYTTKLLNNMKTHLKSKLHEESFEKYKTYMISLNKDIDDAINEPEFLKIGLIKTKDNEDKTLLENVTEDDLFNSFNLMDSNDEPVIMKNKIMIKEDEDKAVKEFKKKEKERERQTNIRKLKNQAKTPKTKEEKQDEKTFIETSLKKEESKLKKLDSQLIEFNSYVSSKIEESKKNSKEKKQDVIDFNEEVNNLYELESEKNDMTIEDIKQKIKKALFKSEYDIELTKNDNYYYKLNEKIESLKYKYYINKEKESDIPFVENPSKQIQKTKTMIQKLKTKLKSI
jgi:hypothetical protein